MAEFPYLPFWTDAYLADCSHLSDAEHGRYILILLALWRTPGCKIPNDDAWLSRRFRRSVEAVRSELRPLIAEFCKTDGNWLWQKRLLLEHKRVTSASKKRSDAAKSMHRNKKQPSQPHARGAEGGHMHPEPYPEPDINTVPSERAKPPSRTPIDLQTELWKSARELLKSRGIADKQAGALIGKWLKGIGPPDNAATLLAILAGAEANCHGDLVPYIEAAIRNRSNANGKQKPSPEQRAEADNAAILRGLGLNPPARGTGAGGNGGPDSGSDGQTPLAIAARH